MNKYIGIDIGGSAIKHALISENGQISNFQTCDTPATLDSFFETIKKIQDSYSSNQIEGIAISMPGLIDSKSGFAFHGGALTYIREMNIREQLQSLCNVPLQIENDGKCAALGEHWVGQLQNVSNGIVLVLGTGIGGGIIINNQLVRGHNLSAGEFSFIQTNIESDRFEYAFAMQSGVKSLSDSYASLKKMSHSKMNGKLFFKDLENGDPDALILFENYTKKMAKQLFNLQTILDPEVISIGGGISQQKILFHSIEKHLDDIINASPFPCVRPTIKQSFLGNKANLLGALAHFKERERTNN
ncbi:ROK family protein [Enterococcus rivorum]|uniref:ROK family protein n=1 Tax=Enterococcus rivorum TaxID=762845 RepID=A0A1E5KUL1_9ENTE|nr:ROK family protein [Enterococcus rivorum]MBP2100579.1 putative NBD/HSP70 family sugar kinase [Enterococcus rivorum]OEH81572.1 ROK family protein [Enterococcus rivorum]